jgi:ubiquinone/menaquinone biosynthesis C-methylase UbiE
VTDISDDDVARHWDANSATWTPQVRKGFDGYRELINNPSIFEMIGAVAGKNILDAGCGEGYNTRKLARMGARMTGIDISSKMLESARQEESIAPLGIEYQNCSFSNMEMLNDGLFDMVVAFMSLMDGPDYAGAIREIYRVLKAGGLLVFSITHPCFLTKGIEWIKNETGLEHRVSVGNYFMKAPYVEKWKFSMSPESPKLPEFEVPSFPRTLSEYLNEIISAGFQLAELREPRPTEEACKRNPKLEKWRKHAAIFLQVKATKATDSTRTNP